MNDIQTQNDLKYKKPIRRLRNKHNHPLERGYDPNDYPSCPACEIEKYRFLV